MGRPKSENLKIQVSVHPELYEALDGLAKKQGRPLAGLAAYILENWMSEKSSAAYPLTKVFRQYDDCNDETE